MSFRNTFARFVCALIAFTVVPALAIEAQQAPLALPNTITTLAGGGAAIAAGAPCPTDPTLTATDTLGDGCPGASAIFGADLRGGLTVDPLGNVFVMDTSNSVVRKIDVHSGIVTLAAGNGTACAAKTDSNGDGCPLANTKFSSMPRGIGSDPWGNIFVAGYNNNLIHILCNAVSPLCPNTTGNHLVGYMYLVAGCVTGTGSAGTGGNGADGGTATPTGTCSASVGEINQARGVSADKFGNVYIGDTANSRYRVVVGPVSFNGVANPLAAAIALNPAYSSVTAATAAGKIYGILGGYTSPAAAAACFTGSAATAADALGDGCPYYVTSTNASTSSAQGVAVDSDGDAIFMPSGDGRLRVLYMGGTNMAKLITIENPTITTPVVGYVYSIAGGGTTTPVAAPTIGNKASLDSNTFKVTVAPNGDIYIGDTNGSLPASVLYFDSATGYIRKLFAAGTNCAAATDSFGDGCPASSSTFTTANGMGLGLDSMGNLFFGDVGNARIREVAATALLPTSVHGSSTQNLLLHNTATSSASGLAASSEVSLGTATCGSVNGDGTVDCTVPVTFAPSQPGTRTAALATSGAASGTLALAGTGTGAALTMDVASPTTTGFGSGLQPAAVAVSGTGNVYAADTKTSKLVQVKSDGSVIALGTSVPTSPISLAVDSSETLYAVGTGSQTVSTLVLGANGAYTAGSIAYTPPTAPAAPRAVAVDTNHTLYVYDATNQAIYRIPTSVIGSTFPTQVGSGYTTVSGLALDHSGNLFVADKGANTVFKIAANGTQTTLATGITPVAIATDAGGTVYVQDSASNSVFAYPVSGPRTTVQTGLVTPAGVAVDGNGVVYSADATQGAIAAIQRGSVAYDFGTSTTATLAGTLGNAGNTAATGFAQTDSTDFAVAAGPSNGCNLAVTSIARGTACTVNATFTPSGSGAGAVSSVVTLLPAATSVGALTLSGTKTGTAVTTTTTVSAPTPASPVYLATGTEVTFTVTVTPSTGSATGTVNVILDGGTPVGYTLTNNSATVTLTGLSAGSHTISAAYPSQAGIVGSSSSTANFSIAQATTSVTWTPGTILQPVSQAIGTTVLNATSNGVPGAFVYTATPSGGSAMAVDAATYLPIGSYSLAVTFTPTDAVDYSGSSASVASYTVVKAATTSAVGATPNLVAADGSGNYTTLSAAVAALPATGGTIYLAPGTYTGQVTIPYPNVSLRGLGGDATKIIITAEAGATPTAQNGGKTGDEGSSTLNIAKTVVGSTTYIPNNFYAENLTVNNTWNTDPNYNPSALVSSGGNCVANTSQLTNNALYLAQTLCYPQALAVWTTSDKAVFNNVQLNSLQDTIYAGSQGSGIPARQYFWKGYISGDIDYVFGDAAAVFDQTLFFTAWHATTAGGGTETIMAQNKSAATGSPNDYLSGYVLNSATLTSQSSGMNGLYLGRPYGQFSTSILLNTKIDQVNPLGWLEFSGQTNLPTSTYAEYNSIPYTDAQGNSGAGVTGTRETTSIAPQVFNAAQAAKYAPVAFLGTPVNGDSWNPTTTLAAQSNAFVLTGPTTIQQGTSVTLLYRPQTPGAGILPTGTYSISDNGNVLTSGTLDATGSAYFTTTALPSGANNLTVTYSGDGNFQASSSSTPYVLTVTPSAKLTPTVMVTAPANAVYGNSVTVSVAVSGTGSAPTGSVSLSVDAGTPINANIVGGVATFTLTGLGAGTHGLSAVYGGDSNYSTANGTGSVSLAKAPLTVTAASFSIAYGQADPTYTFAFGAFVNGDNSSAVTGAPTLSTTPATPTNPGTYTITVAQGTLAAANYSFTFVNGTLTIAAPPTATAVATGDSRTVTEPSFPAVCTTLTAALKSVNDDIPSSVDATVTNPDGARIQAALNACTSGQAVELSADSTGNNAFLSGPINMPSNVTLLVDPGVTLFGSRNAQDYDTVPGTHTCGTVNNNSATSSCQPLININSVSNVGIMGFGKIDGRGQDVVLNAFPASFVGQTWWGLATIANSGGSQQNPRMIQMNGATNVTFYKITLKNATMFHISTTGHGVTGMTIWDIKIVTPTSARNTDGIDPGNAQNVTVTRSYVSDGDDNVAVGASGTIPSQNISIINNHFYAGHGESIGSYTSAGVNNVLYDGNMLSGNASTDSNSTGLRIKSANDRGGVVSNIQYSNSCFQNHKSLIQFTPLYNTNTGTLTPNFNNLLLQNLTFLTEGTVQLTGASNNGTIYPLTVGFDNVSFATLQTSDLNAAPSNTVVTLGPGQVSTNFVNAIKSFAGNNGVVVNDNRTVPSLLPPVCSFTNIAPELTGPKGTTQTITAGQSATAVVILTPTVASSTFPYPTGTVTLTDETGNKTTATLAGTSDTVQVPLPGLAVGTHTITASYSGDSVYVPTVGGTPYVTFGNYTVVVNAGTAASTTTTLQGVPATATFGSPFTATATVAGATDGTVQFLVNGAVYASVSVAGGTAQGTFNLPVGTYSVLAQYTGGTGTGASSSAPVSVTVGPAATTTALTASTTSTTVGVQVKLTATVTSTAGVPTGTVTYSATSNGGASNTVGTASLSNGVANLSVNLPLGSDTVTATYNASGSFAGSSSTAVAITVNPPPVLPLPSNPLALPYTVSTVAGGAASNCAGATDSAGNGCPATQIILNGSSLDLRSVVADPFGNLYFTDANASQVRRISTSGIVTLFAGYVSGTACLPTATTPCTPTLVKLNKPRGVFADPSGNIFIAGYSDNKVYEVKVTDGLLYLIGGNGSRPTDPTTNVGDGLPATQATINQPRSVAADAYGNVYVADTADNRIRQIDASGNIQTVVGTGVSSSTGDNGVASAATVSNPQGVLVDTSSNLYIADSSRVRVVCNTCVSGSALYNLLVKLGVATPTNGNIYTIAGTGSGTYNYTAPALANTVAVTPQKLAMDASSNLYISDGGGVIWFVDSRTGFIRLIAGKGTSCNASSIGDGCPGSQASFGTGAGGGFGVGVDLQGNAYVSDTLNGRIRKISNNLAFPTSATGVSTTQTLVLHMIAGDTLANTTIPLTSHDYTLGTAACTVNADTTQDCTVAATFTPAAAGARTAALNFTTVGNNNAALALTGAGTGTGATLDPAGTQLIGTGITPAAIAVDGQSNIFVADSAGKKLLRFAAGASGTAATSTTLATLNNPVALAVDARGYAYVADSNGSVTQVSPAGASVAFGTFTAPAGLVTDSLNNLYVADSTNAAIYEVSPNGAAQHTVVSTGLTSPRGLAIDASGNLYVADSGNIFKYSPPSTVQTTLSSVVTHIGGFAVDPAGNLILGDTAANAIEAVPASPNTAPFVVTTNALPGVVAMDGAGNVYTGSNGSVLELLRTQGAWTFPNASSAPQTFTLLSTGNQPLALTSVTQTDTTDYSLVAASSADCTVTGNNPSAVVVGGGCSLTATYTPTAQTNTTDVATFNGSIANTSLATPANALQLTLTGMNAPTADSLSLAGPTPAAPTVGQAVSFTATVAAPAGTPAGSVTFTVDGTAQTPVTVASGTASISLTTLTAGSHTVGASFASTNGFAASSATAVTFTVQATPGLTLTVAPAIPSNGNVLQGTSQTFTATLTNGSNPTGTISFLDGTTVLKSGVAISGGVATYTTSTLAVGAHSITAKFTGDLINVAKTSSALTFTTLIASSAGITPTTSNLTVTLSAGGTATATLTYTPNPGYAGTLTFACTGAPATVTCSFAPPSLTFTAASSAPQSTTVTFTSTATHSLLTRPGDGRNTLYLALLLPGLFGMWKLRKRNRLARCLALAVVLSGWVFTMAGCGGSGGSTTTPSATFAIVASDGTNNLTTLVTVVSK
ncbi:MAG TPA: pectinesterase family protein [Acidobacteriaceae bacterium]|jgi:hypothetical protein